MMDNRAREEAGLVDAHHTNHPRAVTSYHSTQQQPRAAASGHLSATATHCPFDIAAHGGSNGAMANGKTIEHLKKQLDALSSEKLELIAEIVDRLMNPIQVSLHEPLNYLGESAMRGFGDILQVHHAFSSESFTKDKFEHALCRVLRAEGVEVNMAPRGNPGHDITVESERWSLKTQADKSIKMEHLHISKFMEMGRGEWETEEHLEGLRDRMLNHMQSYDRIMSLRHIPSEGMHYYELVEIPMELLREARYGKLEMRYKSKQNPKPGYCIVESGDGRLKYQLYFDGGTERKLQVKRLSKEYCYVRASWRFSVR